MRARITRRGLQGLEWFFLLLGLAAIDCCIWIYTGAALYQRYENRAFDQTLGGKPVQTPAVIGRLEIPRLRLTVMVREGADGGTLRRAVGHIPGTALLGRAGNVGLAGHRDTLFRPLRDIHKNDAIVLQTGNGTYRYVVKSTQIVGPRDVDVLAASGGETLTLVTCYPFSYVGSAPQRFIVRAAQVAAIRQLPRQPGS